MDGHHNESIMMKKMVKWAELPEELLVAIAKRLDTEIDILLFRSVCTTWRSSVPPDLKQPSPDFPLQLPVWISPNDRVNREIPGHFNLTQRTVYWLQHVNQSSDSSSSDSISSGWNWIVNFQQVAPGEMHIWPLLSNYQTCNCNTKFSMPIPLSSLHITPISKAYRIQYNSTKPVNLYFLGEYYSLEADKVVVSKKLDGDYAIGATHSAGSLGFLRAGDLKWTVLDDMSNRYEDIVCYGSGFCAVDWRGKAVSFDFCFEPSEIASALPEGFGGKKHLVEMKSTGDLLLVHQYLKDVHGEDYCTMVVSMKLYRLNREMQRWDEMKSLGDEALFVGNSCSFSISVRDFPGVKPGCIFFKDECFRRFNETDDCAGKANLMDDIGVFDMEEQSLQPLAFDPVCSLFMPPSDWGIQPLMLS